MPSSPKDKKNDYHYDKPYTSHIGVTSVSDRLALYQCFVLISTPQKTVLVPLFALKQDIKVGKQN